MNNIPVKYWGLFFTAISAMVLAAVYFSQYVLKMPPCHLCLMERWPYFIALVLGIGLVWRQGWGRWLLIALVLVFVASAALSLFHFGVEQKWWTYNSACTGQSAFKAGATVQEMMTALQSAPSVRCDQAIPFLFGMSMAFYNVLVSVGLMGLAGVALKSSPSPLAGEGRGEGASSSGQSS